MVDMSDPAFPVPDAREYQYCGMTLRDYFAAKAMQGLIAHRDSGEIVPTYKACAIAAYSYADAMLAARGAA